MNLLAEHSPSISSDSVAIVKPLQICSEHCTVFFSMPHVVHKPWCLQLRLQTLKVQPSKTAGNVLFGFRLSEILAQVAAVTSAKLEVVMPRIRV